MTVGSAVTAPTTRLLELREPSALWRADSWLGRASTLWDGERVLGTLRIGGLLGRRARLVTAAGHWRLRHRSLFGERVAEAESGGEAVLVYRARGFGRGRARLASGSELGWGRRSLWRGIWSWSVRDDDAIRFERRSRFPRASFVVTWNPETRGWAELNLLVGFGWWIILEGYRPRGHGS